MGGNQYCSIYESDMRLPSSDPSLPRYDELKLALQIRSLLHQEMYVLAIPRVDDMTVARLRGLEGIVRSVPMGEFTDILVSGTYEDTLTVGKEIHKITGKAVGGFRYHLDKRFTHLEAEQALRTAAEKDVPVYLVDKELFE